MNSKEVKRKYRYYQNKIDKLWAHKQRVESLGYMSQLVEFFVKDAILTFEKIVEGAAVEHHVFFNPRSLYSKKDLEDQPLGYLITILNTYTKDKVLTDELQRFNKMRVRCAHKLLDEEYKEVFKDLKGFNETFYKLMIKLLLLCTKQDALVREEFDHVCDDCFKKQLPKQIHL